MSERIRVFLADDHPIMLEGLRLTISGWEEFEIAGTASDGLQAVEMCRKLNPDMLIIDMHMPGLSGPDAVRQIRRDLPSIRVLALTTFDDAQTVSRAMDAGCNGFLLKAVSPERLKSSMLSVADGLNVYDEDALSHLKKHLHESASVDFSLRELEVLQFVCRGMTNSEIADEMRLRPGTIKNIVSLMLSKSGCISRAQLVRYASDRHLIS